MNMLDSLSVDVLQFYVPNLNYIYHVYLYHDLSPPPSVWRRTAVVQPLKIVDFRRNQFIAH